MCIFSAHKMFVSSIAVISLPNHATDPIAVSLVETQNVSSMLNPIHKFHCIPCLEEKPSFKIKK